MQEAVSVKDPSWSVSPAQVDRFLQYCTRQERGKNHVLCRPGDQAGSLLYLISGSVSVLALEDGDRELTLGEFHAGDFIGEVGLFLPTGPRGVFIRAKTPLEVPEIDTEKFKRLLQKELANDAAVLLYAIGTQLSRRLLDTRRKASSLALLDVEGRIKRALWDLHADNAYPHAEGPAVHISRRDLASRVGCTREVSGRIIKRLAEKGWLADYGKVLVLKQS